jgi:hypothetical protein
MEKKKNCLGTTIDIIDFYNSQGNVRKYNHCLDVITQLQIDIW